jgi:hypothetical protein
MDPTEAKGCRRFCWVANEQLLESCCSTIITWRNLSNQDYREAEVFPDDSFRIVDSVGDFAVESA